VIFCYEYTRIGQPIIVMARIDKGVEIFAEYDGRVEVTVELAD